jgi:hypothetical protein
MDCIRLRTRGAIWSAFFGQGRVHAHLAHHLAHRGLGGLDHGVSGILALEQEGARVAQTVLHGELDLDDVLVFGQHRRISQPGGFDHGVAAHIDGADLRDEHQFMALDRIGQAPVETRTHGGLVAAELGDDGLLAFLDNEESGAKPDQHDHCRHQAGADAGTLHVGLETATAAIAAVVGTFALSAEQAAQLAVEITPELIQVRRPWLGPWPRPLSGFCGSGRLFSACLSSPPRPQRDRSG